MALIEVLPHTTQLARTLTNARSVACVEHKSPL